MLDESPGGDPPTAAVPAPGPDEPSTADLPARWSGSAAVPPPIPRQSLWARVRGRDEQPDPPGPVWGRDEQPDRPRPADAEPDWATTPAVDPWADQDTPAWIRTEQAPVPPPTLIEPPGAVPAPAPAITPAPAPLPVPAGRRHQPPKQRRTPSKSRPPDRRLPAPPPWAPRPAARPLPAPPRRRRRWLRRLTWLSLFGFACCCGAPIAVWQWPALRQYPVNAVLPQSFADLKLRDDSTGRRAADRLAEQLQEAGAEGEPFAGVYSDARGKRLTVFGVTGWRFTPGSDVSAQLDRLTDELGLTGVQSFDVGESGVHQRCGTGRLDGTAVVVCAWADHGSLATVVLTRRSVADSADLVARLRTEVLTHG